MIEVGVVTTQIVNALASEMDDEALARAADNLRRLGWKNDGTPAANLYRTTADALITYASMRAEEEEQ